MKNQRVGFKETDDDVSFKYWKMVPDRKTGNQKRVPQARWEREETTGCDIV